MAEGVGFPFPSLLLNEGRTYGQPEVVLISLPQVATGLRLRLLGSFRRRVRAPDTAQIKEKGVGYNGDFSYDNQNCWQK